MAKRLSARIGKKGAFTESMVLWIPKILFTVIVVLSFLFIISYYLKDSSGSALLQEAEILSEKMVRSSDGLAFEDSYTKRTYPGIIDLSKLRDVESLENRISYGDGSTYLGMKMTLYDRSGKAVEESVYNEDAYRRVAESGIRGKGGVEEFEKSYYVLVKDKGLTFPGRLKLSIIVSRS